MHCIFHLMWSVWKCGEHHRSVVFIHLKEHSSALAISYFCPADFFFCTTFLWNHISRHVICNFVCVDAEFCTFFTIRIGFCLTKSIPFYAVIICIEFEDYTKFRHIFEFFNRVISKRCFYSSIPEYFIGKPAFTGRCSRHKVCISYLYSLFIHFYFRYISRAIRSLAEVLVT